MTTVQAWNDRDFLHAAYMVAARESDDAVTQNGAVLVNQWGTLLGSGANGFPSGVTSSDERLERPLKYIYFEHAERAAIFAAAAHGHKTAGATLYCPYSACAECARAIIAAGIVRVVSDERLLLMAPERWRESIEHGNTMLDEAGVRRSYLNTALGGVIIKFDGQDFYA